MATKPTETTPLIAPPPTTADAAPEAHLDSTPDDADVPLPRHRLAIAAVGLASLIFLQATNISMLTTTQSAIAADLHASDQVSWFSSAYLIAMSAVGPLNGKLAGIFSPRTCIFAASTLLALGTLTTSYANDFNGFVLGRVITGIGASGIFTVSIILVLDMSSASNRGLAVGMLNSGYTIGVATGAVAAGALLPLIGWRWIFLGQAPIALVGGLAILFSIPASYATGERSTKSVTSQLARLDYLGSITLTATIVLVLYALSAKHIPLWPLITAPFVLVAFVLTEIYWASDPIIPVTLLRSRGLLLTCLATVGYMMARWSVLFYTPTYAIALRGWSPAVAGAVLVPTNTGFALGGLLVGWLHIRRHGSFYLPTLIVYAIFPLTLIWLSTLVTRDSSITWFVIDVLVCGFVTGAALNYNLAHMLHLTPKSTHYIASSLLATFRGFSGSFGSAIGGGLFTRTLYQTLEAGFAERGLQRDELVQRLLGSPALVQTLEGVERDVAMTGYEAAFRTLFLAGAGLSALTVLVQAGTGWKAAPEDEKLEEETDSLIDDREAHRREDDV